MKSPLPPTPSHAGWDAYWSAAPGGSLRLYSAIAGLYRRVFIRPRLEFWMRRSFRPGAELLHAGCGGGEVDANLGSRFRITALDISSKALDLYKKNNPAARAILHADLLEAPLPAAAFDGAYNLGVMEHFHTDEIVRILSRLHRTVRPGGRLLVFWPLATAPSVKVLRWWHRFLEFRQTHPVRLHPPEHTLLESKEQAARILDRAGWELERFSVSPADLFIQAVLVCARKEITCPAP
jgi:SAM-dependent methyltransferase